MRKSDLVNVIADVADISKLDADNALSALLEQIELSLAKGESVNLTGFGAFSVKERAARTGRNPQTGATMEIAASRQAVFKAGKGLKDTVNS